jgi:hypothetical protein
MSMELENHPRLPKGSKTLMSIPTAPKAMLMEILTRTRNLRPSGKPARAKTQIDATQAEFLNKILDKDEEDEAPRGGLREKCMKQVAANETLGNSRTEQWEMARMKVEEELRTPMVYMNGEAKSVGAYRQRGKRGMGGSGRGAIKAELKKQEMRAQQVEELVKRPSQGVKCPQLGGKRKAEGFAGSHLQKKARQESASWIQVTEQTCVEEAETKLGSTVVMTEPHPGGKRKAKPRAESTPEKRKLGRNIGLGVFPGIEVGYEPRGIATTPWIGDALLAVLDEQIAVLKAARK